MRDRKRVDPNGKEVGKRLGGVEEGKPIIKIDYVRKNQVYFK